MLGAEMIEFNRCTTCGAMDACCVHICAKCLGSRLESVLIPGQGTLVSWTTVRKPPLRFKAEGAYHVGVFVLDQGVQLTGRFLPGKDDRIGDRVIAVPSLSAGHASATFRVANNA